MAIGSLLYNLRVSSTLRHSFFALVVVNPFPAMEVQGITLIALVVII
jgi:hypothetical protein